MTKSEKASGMRLALGAVIRKNPVLTAGLILVIIADILLSLVPPLVLEKIINSLAAGGGGAAVLGVWFFGLLALSGIFDSGQSVLITVFGQKMTHALRSAMCAKLKKLPADYFTQNPPGVTVSRFVNDVDTVETLFDEGIISMFADGCKVIGIIAVVFTRSLGLGLLLVILTPIILRMTGVFRKKMLSSQLSNRKAMARVANHVPETILNIRTIHAFGGEKYMEERYGEYIEQSYRSREKSNLYDSVYSPIVVVTGAAVTALMMVLAASGGGMRELFGMSVGTAVAVTAYVGKVFSPLESIGMEIENIQSAAAGARRVDELLGESCRHMPDMPAPSARGTAVEIKDVDFSYDGETPVLENFSLCMDKGDKVTLAGRTGAGKSTVVKLLLGLYAPQKGTAKVFGTPCADIADGEKRGVFGYVEQCFRLVPGTVGEQISLFDESMSGEKIRAAARLAGLDEMIMELPEGYDTPFREELFSRGQAQLLSIARAVAADPEILLLDEITANLDSGTEKAVLDAIGAAAKNRTVLSVSHRLYRQGDSVIAQM